MKFLEKFIKSNNSELSETTIQEYQQIKEKFKTNNIYMSEDAQLMFSNHIVCFLERIHKNTLIDPIDEELRTGVSVEALSIAQAIVKGIFEKYGVNENMSEIFLFATHIQIAMTQKKGGNTDE